MNGKKEPPTLRLKKLIENLSDYKFDIKFLRGKDMFVSDFLSRHPDNEESCNVSIIPVALLMKEIVLPEHTPKFMEWLHIMLDSREMLAYKKRDYKECQCERVMSMKEPFRVMTRSMAKTAKAEVPAMYQLQGDHKKPEKSQIGIIEVKDKEEQGQGEIQVDNTTHQPNDGVMAEIDNMEIPDRVMRPIAHKMPDMANLQIPPVLNEPIPMKAVKKATPVIDYDQILAPVNIDEKGSHYMISDWTGQLSHKRFHVNRLKPFSLNLGKVKDGKLQTVHNTRELFRIWKNIKRDAEIEITAMQTQD